MIRVIWTYWEGRRSALVAACIASWCEHMPDWEIHVLNDRDVEEKGFPLPTFYRQLSPQLKSDVARLMLLCASGGLWLDATVFLKGPIQWPEHVDRLPYWGCLYKAEHPESWLLLAANANDAHMCLWRDSFIQLLHARFPNVPYYCIYDAFKGLARSSAAFRKTFEALPLQAVTQGNGLYSIFRPLSMHRVNFIKLTSTDRILHRFLCFPSVYVIGVVFLLALLILRGLSRNLRGDVPSGKM